MSMRISTGLKIFLLVSWTLLVLWNYFWSFPLLNLPEILQNGFMLAVLLLFFTALGRRLLRITSINFGSFAEEISLSFGIGTGVVIFLLFILAVVGALYEVVIVGLILVLFALIYSDAKTICLRVYDFLRSFPSQSRALPENFFLFLLALAGSATFFAAATPPFFYDALMYHLAVPQQYLLNHGFQYMPHHHYSNFPMNLGMLFIVGMSFSGGMLAQLLSWSFAPMSALAVYGFAKSRWGRQTALTASTILVFVPGVLVVSTLTSVDLGTMFYSCLGFFALLSWGQHRQKFRLVFAAVFCGLAIGTKYTALVTTFAPMFLVLLLYEVIYAKKHRGVFGGIRSLVLFNLVIFCIVLPWIAKNVIYTENPVYPFFNHLFGSQASELVAYTQVMQRENPMSTHWLMFILQTLKAPWTITMTTSGSGGKTGVLFLLYLPLLFFLKIKTIDPLLKWGGLLAGTAFVGWLFFLPRMLRYIFPLFPVLSLIIAYSLWKISISKQRRLLTMLGVCGILLYQLMMFGGELTILSPLAYLFRNASQEEFLLAHGVNYYPAIQYVNRELSHDARVLFVAETRSYYAQRAVLLHTIIEDDNEIILRKFIVESENLEELLLKLRQEHITHILINHDEMQRFTKTYLKRESYFNFQTQRAQKIFQRFFSSSLRLLTSEYGVDLYEIRYPAEKS